MTRLPVRIRNHTPIKDGNVVSAMLRGSKEK